MKNDFRDYGASLAEWKDTKPGMFENWGEVASSLGGLLILVVFFLALFVIVPIIADAVK